MPSWGFTTNFETSINPRKKMHLKTWEQYPKQLQMRVLLTIYGWVMSWVMHLDRKMFGAVD